MIHACAGSVEALAVRSRSLTVAVLGAYCTTCADRCRRSTGRPTVPGISAPIDIIRDADAIPHIFAADQGRRAVRPRLRARAGSPVADGVPAPHRLRPAVGDLRRGRRCRRIGFCAPSASAARRSAAWAATPEWAKAAGQRLRRRRQRVHRHASRHRAAARVLAAAVRAGAVDRRRRHRVGEDDGLGSERQLLVRAAAPRSRSHGRRGTDGAADAAVRDGWAFDHVAGGGR